MCKITGVLTLLLGFFGIWTTGFGSGLTPALSDSEDTITHPYFPYEEGDRLFFQTLDLHTYDGIPIPSGAHRVDVVVDTVASDGRRYYTFARKQRDLNVWSDTVHYQQEYTDSMYYAVDPDSNIMQYNPVEETYHTLLKWEDGSPEKWEPFSWEVESSNMDSFCSGPIFCTLNFNVDDVFSLLFASFEDDEYIQIRTDDGFGRFNWELKKDVGAYSFVDGLPDPPSPIELQGGIIQGNPYADSTIIIRRDPATPNQATPEDGADDFDSEVTFSWDEAWPDELYEFQLAEGSYHDQVILSDTLKETSITLGPDQLESHTTYSWRVRGIREVNLPETNYLNSSWSGTRTLETGEMTSAEEEDQIPLELSLEQNYPNPFNPDTRIRYELPRATPVTLEVYNISGEHITTLVDALRSAGSHSVVFDGAELTSGAYIYRLETDEQVISKTMMLIK